MNGKFWIALFTAVLLVSLSGCQGETLDNVKNMQKEQAENSIVVATDLHHLATGLKDDGKAMMSYIANGDGKLLQYSDEILETFVKEVINLQPMGVILSGDLTNNGEKASHQELAGYLAKIEAAGIPVMVIPGNHDLRNPFALGFEKDKRMRVESVEASEFVEIYDEFGYREALSRDPNSLSYLVQVSEECALLMLDTNRYAHNMEIGVPNPSGAVKKETMEWMKSALEAIPDMEVVAVMHHNAFPHTEMFIDNYVIDNSEEVMTILSEMGISVTLSGHIHIQDLKQDPNTGIYDFTTTAMSVYPHRYGTITLDDKSIDYQTRSLNVAAYAKEWGLQDENLLNFDSYSKRDFAERAKAMVLSQMPATLSQADRQAMADVMAELNLAYFAGEEADLKAEIMEMEGFEALRNLDSPFLQHYIASILLDETNDNQITVQREES